MCIAYRLFLSVREEAIHGWCWCNPQLKPGIKVEEAMGLFQNSISSKNRRRLEIN